MEDAVVGDDAEPEGTRLTVSFEDWPDDAEAEVAPHRQPVVDHRGAGLSTAPAASGGAQKRRAASILFGSRPKKSKASTAVTKRDEAAAKAARFRKAVKQPQAVSA